MATLLIRNLDEDVKRRLRLRAAAHGRSMEAEARDILDASLRDKEPTPRDLGRSVHERFAAAGSCDLKLPAREPMRDPPDFAS